MYRFCYCSNVSSSGPRAHKTEILMTNKRNQFLVIYFYLFLVLFFLGGSSLAG